MVNNWLKIIQDFVVPPVCLLCQAAGVRGGTDLCAECMAELPRMAAACSTCAMALPVEGQCGQCQQKPPTFDRTTALFHYQPPVDWLIQGLKFRAKLTNGRFLGEQMAEFLAQKQVLTPDLIIPVPLHPQRLRERGFNQALELAKPISKALAVPLWQHVERIVATEAQSLLPLDKRRNNVKGSFRVNRPLEGARVAIVDDVMTSGSTIGELAHVLRLGGAKSIDVFVCARVS